MLQQDEFFKISKEPIKIIFGFLDWRSKTQCIQTCKEFRDIIYQEISCIKPKVLDIHYLYSSGNYHFVSIPEFLMKLYSGPQSTIKQLDCLFQDIPAMLDPDFIRLIKGILREFPQINYQKIIEYYKNPVDPEPVELILNADPLILKVFKVSELLYCIVVGDLLNFERILKIKSESVPYLLLQINSKSKHKNAVGITDFIISMMSEDLRYYYNYTFFKLSVNAEDAENLKNHEALYNAYRRYSIFPISEF